MSASEPELQLIEMLRSLTTSGVEFLVFGAVAGAMHGHLRATADLDIILRPTTENIDRLLAWLAANDDLALRVVDRQTLIERKRLRGSPQDLVDVAALEALDAAG